MIYMIDHFDSFTYNIVQLIGEMGEEVVVRRNDAIDFEEIDRLDPDLIFLSPGPRRPEETGMTLQIIERYKGIKPIFGVCLGHQAIAHAFGGSIRRTHHLMHGKTSKLHHNGEGLYQNITDGSEVMNYHSLVVDESTLPECFEITAASETGEILGLKHKTLPIEGVQFHPESIASTEGRMILKNMMNRIGSNIK